MEHNQRLHYQQHQQKQEVHSIDGGQQQVEEQRDEMQEQHTHQNKVKHYMHNGQ
jgi:hypothetical protein